MEKKADRSGKADKVSEYKRLVISLAILFVIISAFILYLSWPLLTGTTIVLDTRPVDPFDPLRGQYMAIAYEIGQIPSVPEAKIGEEIYVHLEEDDTGIFRYKNASLSKPENTLFIRGSIKTVYSTMRVEYGIEQFFFERNADVPTRNITVEAKVSKSGRARIVNLLQDGEPVEIGYKPVSKTS